MQPQLVRGTMVLAEYRPATGDWIVLKVLEKPETSGDNP